MLLEQGGASLLATVEEDRVTAINRREGLQVARNWPRGCVAGYRRRRATWCARSQRGSRP